MHHRRENIDNTLNPHLNGAGDGINRVRRPLHLVEISRKLRTRQQAKQQYTHLKSRKKKNIYTHEQYEDLVFNGDEEVGGGSRTPREGEPALGAMRFVQLEVG